MAGRGGSAPPHRGALSGIIRTHFRHLEGGTDVGTESIAVREVRDSDMGAVAEIYGHHVRHGVATFEYEPPDVAELRRRCGEVRARGLPYVVAERDSRLLGFAYASPSGFARRIAIR